MRVTKSPIEYYDKHLLWRIGNKLGKIVKVDSDTIRQKAPSEVDNLVIEKARFAQICIEVNSKKVLVSRF